MRSAWSGHEQILRAYGHGIGFGRQDVPRLVRLYLRGHDLLDDKDARTRLREQDPGFLTMRVDGLQIAIGRNDDEIDV